MAQEVNPLYLMTGEQREDIYRRYRVLTGNKEETISDELLDEYLLDIVSRIVIYCNRDDLPVRIHGIIPKMLAYLLPKGSTGGTTPPSMGNIKAVTVGRAKVDYDYSSSGTSDKVSVSTLDALLLDYAEILSTYRRVGLFRNREGAK